MLRALFECQCWMQDKDQELQSIYTQLLDACRERSDAGRDVG